MNLDTHPYFVANDSAGTRKETATLLVGTAREFNISQQDIASTHDGFYITEALADVLSREMADEADEQAEVSGNETPAKPKATTETAKKTPSDKKTSGNRAAKNDS